MAVKTPASPPRRPRPRAIVLAEHGEAPVRLTSSEKALLDEALRRGEDLREQVETNVTSYGRWLLGSIFGGNASAALDDKSSNVVWRELVRRAGGPTLRIGRRMLYVALQLAARDKRIADTTWRGLDAGRKELLLPLGDDARLREAAQHVAKFNLTQTTTRQYVSGLLAATGRAPAVRLTMPRLVGHVQKLRAAVGTAAALRKVEQLREAAEPREREKAADEVEQLRVVLGKIARSLRART
ncbi:MAG TPA: hypothetical protein VLT33_34195 [Labilithrix sp.]|nr:hypothetical protein [Labilithrix sp.]